MWTSSYYVYILTDKNKRVLCTGVTNDLLKKVSDHKERRIKGFSSKYEVDQLVYFEWFDNKEAAIEQEKLIRIEPRERKMDRVSNMNRRWADLYENYGSVWQEYRMRAIA